MKNIFIQNTNFAEYSNSENLEQLVKDTYERLEVITEVKELPWNTDLRGHIE